MNGFTFSPALGWVAGGLLAAGLAVLAILEIALFVRRRASSDETVWACIRRTLMLLIVAVMVLTPSVVSSTTSQAINATDVIVAEEIEKDLFLKCSGRQPRSREGLTEGQWVLLDYGDFVIHVMHEESREFYGLERLWRDCPAIDLELAHPETAEHAEDAAVTTA